MCTSGRCRSGAEIGKNFPDDIFRQLRDEPGLLGWGIKISGDKKCHRAAASGRGLRPGNFPFLQRNNRLIVNLNRFGIEGVQHAVAR